MKKRWRVILPIIGLLLFALGVYAEFHFNRGLNSHRYFWYSGIRLDRDPLNRHPWSYWYPACRQASTNCEGWDPVAVWVDPGFLSIALFISGAPAFAVGGLLVRGLGKLGVNELITFMFAMPLLIAGWYFLVGWFVDWFRYRILNGSRPVPPLPDGIPQTRP